MRSSTPFGKVGRQAYVCGAAPIARSVAVDEVRPKVGFPPVTGYLRAALDLCQSLNVTRFGPDVLAAAYSRVPWLPTRLERDA